MTFKELGLHESLLEGLNYAGFENATPIQEQAIPAVLGGRDLIACAQTGTGKTGAFLLPVMHALTTQPSDGNAVLIITPTRELALQIDMQVQGFGYFTKLHSVTVYGGGDGSDFSREKDAFKKGTPIVVATPGKLMAHMNMGYVDFSKIRYLILDEADRMLDMGFIDDIEKIIESLPKERQNLMFSATMAPKIRKLAHKLLKDPFEINLSIAKPAAGVTQRAFLAFNEQKLSLIDTLLTDDTYESILVFCSRKNKVSEVVRLLKRKGYDAQGISSDLEQKEREELLLKFRARQVNVLVATDVLSRGIDIQGIQLVINFDVPNHPEDYVHRVGRTARADTKGVAVTLISPDDMRKFQQIEQLIERELEKETGPESLGPAPEWRTDQRGGGGDRKGNRRKPQERSRKKPSDGPAQAEDTPREKPTAAVSAKSEEPAAAAAQTPDSDKPAAPKRRRPNPRKPRPDAAETKPDAPVSGGEQTPNSDKPAAPKRRRPNRRKPRLEASEGTPKPANESQPRTADEHKPRPKRRRPPRASEDGQSNARDTQAKPSEGRSDNQQRRRNTLEKGKKRPSERQERMNAGNERTNIFDQKGRTDRKPKTPQKETPKKTIGGFIKKLFGKK
jgi:superfamily II DNA/RNA helicase